MKTTDAKEKAKELYEKFYCSVDCVEARDGGGWDNCTLVDNSVKDVAKQCALIAVEEILLLARESQDPDHIAWWEECRKEIESL